MNRRAHNHTVLRAAALSLLVSIMFLPALAQHDRKHRESKQTAPTTIANFGQVNDHIYRGAQPRGDQYRQLVTMGIKTIVDLRGDMEADAKSEAERAGLQYISLPLEPKKYPQADAAPKFLEIVNNQANWPVYVHCAGGRHRTGSMIAVYRMSVDQWPLKQAYAEMKDYDFYTFGGHGCYKEYVNDYSKNVAQMASRPVEAGSEASSKAAGKDNDKNDDDDSSLKDMTMMVPKKLFGFGKQVTNYSMMAGSKTSHMVKSTMKSKK